MKDETGTCAHVWVYDHQAFEDIFLRCPYCGMVRLAELGEPAARVSKELNIRHDDQDGDV